MVRYRSVKVNSNDETMWAEGSDEGNNGDQ